jgi:hypothetical protein
MDAGFDGAEAEPRPGQRDGNPRVFLWAAWCTGPATFGAAFVTCLVRPGICSDPPNLRMGCWLVVSHLVAGAMSLGLLFFGRAAWRLLETKLLLAYWLGLGCWLLPVFLREVLPTPALLSWVGVTVSAAVTAAMPLLILVRWLGFARAHG